MRVKFALSLVLLLMFASVIYAETKIEWGEGSPSAKKGEITASGTYNLDPGDEIIGSVSLVAYPTGGGANVPPASATPKDGKWGPATLKNVVKGQYTVLAIMNVKRKSGKLEPVSSPTAIVSVP